MSVGPSVFLIAEASVAKLYPGRLQIEVTERKAFALWQKDRKIWVISEDGIVLEPYLTSQFTSLPLVVGVGAERKARELLALIDKYPAVSSQLYASVLVADRRWNLKLRNGMEILLPESGVERALDTLVGLDRDKKLLSRDIVAIDLRRVAVLRTGSDFDRPYPHQGVLESMQAQRALGSALRISADNLVRAGMPLVEAIVRDWNLWQDGVPQR